MKSAAAAKRNAGASRRQAIGDRKENASEIDGRPCIAATAAKAKRNAGSAREENVVSRLAPMPSKLDQVSKAETTVRKRADPNK